MNVLLGAFFVDKNFIVLLWAAYSQRKIAEGCFALIGHNEFEAQVVFPDIVELLLLLNSHAQLLVAK